MIALIIDTETTGLYKEKDNTSVPVYADRVVQVGYQIISIEQGTNIKTTLFEGNQLVRQHLRPNQKLSNQITPEELVKYGVSPLSMLIQLNRMMLQYRVDTVVGHNIDFDLRAIKNEFDCVIKSTFCPNERVKEMHLYRPFNMARQICTMHTLTPIMKLPHRGEPKYDSAYKYPNLAEAYDYLFTDKLTDQALSYLHNAFYDASVTTLIFTELLKKDLITYKEIKPWNTQLQEA